MKSAVRRSLARVGLKIVRATPSDRGIPEFGRLLSEIQQHTLVTPDRLFRLYQFAKYASCIAGDIAELGVYRGGTARMLASACPGKRLMLFDTFAGLPAADPTVDGHQGGDFSETSLPQVQAFLSDCPNVEWFPGFFPDSAAGNEARRFSLVYVDGDLYQSTKDALAWFYPRLVTGGVMVFDDYGSPRCEGVQRAIAEFIATTPNYPIQPAPNQCVLIKGTPAPS